MDFLKQNSIQSNNFRPNHKVPTGNNSPDTTATFSALIQAISLKRQQDNRIKADYWHANRIGDGQAHASTKKNAQIPETLLRLRRRVPTKLASTDEYLGYAVTKSPMKSGEFAEFLKSVVI